MTSLYLDSSDKLFIGLLSSENQWISYNKTDLKKGASNLHKLVHQLLAENNVEINHVSRLIHISGPGSYTGIRITEGFCQILDWNGFETHSFYHFDVPFLVGVTEGTFVSHAFKGELYFHHLKNGESGLLPLDQLDILEGPLYTHYFQEPFDSAELTSQLIIQNPEQIFGKIIDEGWRKPPFYYRKLEDEFKVQSD